MAAAVRRVNDGGGTRKKDQKFGWTRLKQPTKPLPAHKAKPFFVLHKAAAAAASSLPSSRGRRRIDASLPSSPNPKSAKRPRDVDAQDEESPELYEQLRLEAFHRTWSKIQLTIDVRPSLFSSIPFCFSIFTSLDEHNFTSWNCFLCVLVDCHQEVLRGINLKLFDQNAEFVDDITTFRDLAGHLQSNGCHLTKLSATELSAKHGVGGCFRSLLRQLVPDVPDVADVSVLASWYCEAENYDQPIIVIIDDLEQCSGDVLGELVMMLSEWMIKVPIFFKMGIATTLDAPKKLLSSEALQRLEPCNLTLGSPSDRMNALVEAILVKPCAGFCISHEVAIVLRNYFFRHDGTVTSFISALKYAFGLPSCTSISNSSNFGNDVVKGLSELLKLQKDWSSVLLCLYEAGRHDKVQLLDIFCEAVNPHLQTQNRSNVDMFVSKMNSEKLSGVKLGSDKVFTSQVMNAVRSNKVKELRSTAIDVDSARATKEKWTRCNLAQEYGDVVNLHD
ncbi:hypothetical protein HU200_028877 [Digitaria exilis]|uniref:Origin recognition complex subunit 3 N-terminal domain-containing protein n=1 Tax=Digitaria exilis TaxID=1010633 RepID=A0A835BU57_9POAL|nr:hypothetical protein HU200_028877 [Digitaria exilis]